MKTEIIVKGDGLQAVGLAREIHAFVLERFGKSKEIHDPKTGEPTGKMSIPCPVHYVDPAPEFERIGVRSGAEWEISIVVKK